MNTLMQDILNGLRPASDLQDPLVQNMSKAAYGFVLPPHILPQPKELIQKRQAAAIQAAPKGSAQERAITGVPSEEVAGAQEATTILKGREAGAQMTEGLPEAKALTEKAVLQAQQEGANLNTNIFHGALFLLGTDKRFAELSYEAATGALDARIKHWEMQRANLTIERQKLVDNARALHDISVELAKSYDDKIKSWRNGLNQATVTLQGKERDEAQANYIAANPPPDRSVEYKKAVKSWGMTLDEFQRRYKDAMSKVFEPDVTGTRQSSAVSRTAESAPDLGKIVARAMKLDPKEAADALVALIDNETITDIQAKVVVRSLRLQSPGSWFKRFNSTYSVSGTSGDQDDERQ